MQPKQILTKSIMNYGGGRKRIFIGLLLASSIVMAMILLIFLVLPWWHQLPAIFPFICVVSGFLGVVVLAWLCLGLVYNIYTGKSLPGIVAIRHAIIRLMLPLMEFVGKFFGIEKDVVRRSFIKVNNEFVLNSFSAVPADKILLLLPHCLQNSLCPRRLIDAMDNCAHCGKCQIGILRDLADKFGFRMAVATGGTIARRIVVECKPRYILAVACERDLTSGIQDSYPIPVFGILNDRPHGPCRDTSVSIAAICAVLSYFLDKSCPVNLPAGNISCMKVEL